ncbi:MAG: classical arabinogalactan protein 4, partial [Stenotrophomonas maltophilia]
MYRPRRLAAALLVLLPLSAAAQIGPPLKPTATRPVLPPSPAPAPLPIPVQPAPADSLSGQMAPVKSSSQTQQQLRTHPIQSKGPSQPAPMQGPAIQGKVYDRHGRIIPGAR